MSARQNRDDKEVRGRHYGSGHPGYFGGLGYFDSPGYHRARRPGHGPKGEGSVDDAAARGVVGAPSPPRQRAEKQPDG